MEKFKTIKEMTRMLSTLAKEEGLAEIEVEDTKKQIRIRICQYGSTPTVATAIAPTKTIETPEETLSGHSMKAPLIGTVYLAPAPGEPPFVAVGDTVQVGDTVCLIEAMKTFNHIEADKTGVIKKRLVKDSQIVEYDQPLFIIEEA